MATAYWYMGNIDAAIAECRRRTLRHVELPPGEDVHIEFGQEHGPLAQLPGVVRTQTMVAFEAFSEHDLEALFSVGG